MPTTEIRKALNRMKEMIQFGPGVTFADMMEQFRSVGEAIYEIWPWVPFSPDGNLRCTILPIGPHHGYELILVSIKAPVRFPNDDDLAFRIKGIRQEITVIEGQVDVEFEHGREIYTEGHSAVINNDELVAYHYYPGVYLFKQVPRVASEIDFSFDKFTNE